MKKDLFKFLLGLAIVGFGLVSCEKEKEDDPVDATASFSSEQTTDKWHYKLTNTSTASGTATWELGNGSVATGDVVEVYYPVAGEYTVKLTVSGSAGVLTAEETITIDATDAAFFSHPIFDALTGGLENTAGKKWFMDKNLAGHYGLGPGNGDWSSYHASAGGAREGYGYYDDELTFVLDGFVAKFYTGADGKVVCRQPEQAKKSAYYANGVDPEGSAGYEYAVEYAAAADASNPLTQSFAITITEGEGVNMDDLIAIQFIGDAPMNPFFDPGAVGNTWYVDSFDDNHMTLYCQAAADYDIDGSTTYYQIKMAAEGHLSIPATYEASATVGEGGAVNFEIAHTGGAAISNVNWAFGDANEGTGVSTAHTYATNQTYNATATVTDEIGVITSATVVVTVNTATDIAATVVDWSTFEGADALAWTGMNPDVDGIVDDGGNNVLTATLAWQWANTFAPLGGELDITTNTVIKFKVKGKAGARLAVNLYNKTDFEAAPYGADAHPLQLFYDILADDTWEEVVFDFGLHAGYAAERATGWYDDITIFLNPGAQPSDPQDVIYLDDFQGPALP